MILQTQQLYEFLRLISGEIIAKSLDFGTDFGVKIPHQSPEKTTFGLSKIVCHAKFDHRLGCPQIKSENC